MGGSAVAARLVLEPPQNGPWRASDRVAALLADAAEDGRFGKAFRADELPEELRRLADRLAAVRSAKERLEARQRQADEARGRKPGQKRNPKGGRPYKREYGEPDGKAQEKITDSQSRIMKIRAIAGSRMLWCQAILQQRCRSHAHQARALLSAGMPIHRT